MSSDGEGIELTVKGAEKRDAGRGVARVPEDARQRMGVLSGDTVLIEGERTAVAKVWPAGAETPPGTVRIDADTRANAGVTVGDAVAVRPQAVEDARSVTLSPSGSISESEREAVERVVKRDLRDRPVSEGERIRIERLGGDPFVVSATDPEGVVRITNRTSITVRSGGTAGAAPSAPEDEGPMDVTYEDIGGLDEELDQVREMIELPLSEPELFRRLGVDPPKGVLLHGPPGTGKTLIAKAVANEVDASFHLVNGPEIMSKYKGESEERVREIFEEAEANSPAIVFFDEIDAIAEKREDSGDMESRVVAQLLSIMDGLDPRGDVIVIAATNRVDAIDPALRRGGRFDREIAIGVPDEQGRREILAVHARGMPLAEDVDLDRVAAQTHGFVGADLAALVTEAGMSALRRVRGVGSGADAGDGVEASGADADAGDADASDEDSGGDEMLVTRADFEAALAAVDPSAMREYVAETPSVSYDGVGGLDEAKATLKQAVEWPLSYSPLFEAARTDPPSGILLYGPPGTGKTLLARAVASESGVNFIHVNGPEIMASAVGAAEEAVRDVFDRARQAAPAIIFFDELDAIAGQRGRGDSSNEVGDRVVSQLLTELDGLVDNPNLVALAATNRKDAIDPALLRPGRFEEHLLVPEPDRDARREILAVHTRGKPLAEDVDLDDLADRLEGHTGADIDSVIRSASLLAIEKVAHEVSPAEAADRASDVEIRAEHVEAALEDAGIE
ncbi:AAA family ATPase [Halobacteriales archaeon QS_1_68_20]|nr:MAG: AAA family ATPase [Halobacteriales archaeon QS_1_68_20]